MYFHSVDLGVLASSETSLYGSTVFSKADKSGISKTKVNCKSIGYHFDPVTAVNIHVCKCMYAKMFIFF